MMPYIVKMKRCNAITPERCNVPGEKCSKTSAMRGYGEWHGAFAREPCNELQKISTLNNRTL